MADLLVLIIPIREPQFDKDQLTFMRNEANTSVLVIDDEEMVRDNIEDILVPKGQTEEQDMISDAANILFDVPKPLLSPRTRNIPIFTVDKAANGSEGVKRVK